MSYTEKINIFVSNHIAETLENDARQFEIYKMNSTAINMNRFLNMLIAGYFDTYTEQYKQLYDQIKQILSQNGMSNNDDLNIPANTIIKAVTSSYIHKKKGLVARKISLKPTSLTESIFSYIDHYLNDDSLSQFFCRMFTSYAGNPLNVRERIIFKETYEILKKACIQKQQCSFITNRNSATVHEVLPYALSVGKEELFNYLICQEYNNMADKKEAATYRLNRISKIRITTQPESLLGEVKHHLEMMKVFGPQFSINEDVITCVKMTEKGIHLFNRIYFGRPLIDHIEKTENSTLYYFRCSQNQLYLYFRRFNDNHAIVLYPETLRQSIIDFHKNALAAYSSE